ncbi:MAG: hypothetical protein WBG71_06770 [Leeuwenhoekiella sp.]
MRLIKFLFVVAFGLISCTVEPELEEYTSVILNRSQNNLEILGFDSRGSLVFEDVLQVNQSSKKCSSQSETFLGIGYGIDSIVIKFSNEFGYSCSFQSEQTQLCIPSKSPFVRASFEEIEKNTFQFTINQEDFENAFELPD